MKDFQNKKGRLTKRNDKADFRLADNDDFFGFSEPVKTETWEKIMLTLLALGAGYYIYQAITFIF
jgi:hypothetical protein